MFRDFLSLLYPHICASCGSSLYKHEYSLCTFCVFHLPRTHFHRNPSNPIAKIFWGRIDIHSAAAYYNFGKGSKVQHLIHQLKYKGKQEIGISIGKLYGFELLKEPDFNTINSIIPVPLHKKKKNKRGYNQSECFAEGLSKSMNVRTIVDNLIRINDSETQTRKSRYTRWENVETIFTVKDPPVLYGQHVLLVDDVITTGATLEACAQTLKKIPDIKISIATIAYANI